MNNALPIVKLMVDSGRADVAAAITDGNTPLSVVRNCLSQGFEDYRPITEFLQRVLASAGSAAGEGQGQLAVALASKEAGNSQFQSGEFQPALHCYKRVVDLCKEARQAKGADRAACDELLVTANANAAACCLRLGSSLQAESFCESALSIAPDHPKAKARLVAARKATAEHETGFLQPFGEAQARVHTLSSEGKYTEAASVAAQAAQMANRAADRLLEAKALLSVAEMHLAIAQTSEPAEADEAAEFARESANVLLAHCHHWEKHGPLSNTRKRESVLTAHLQSCEAMAWLFMARLDISARGNVTEGRRKLTGEVLRLLRLVESACPSSEMEMAPRLAEANARQLLVQACVLLNELDAALTAAAELVSYVEEFDSVAFRCEQLCDFVVAAAESLADGRSQACLASCERLLRFAIAQAEAQGDLRRQAQWLRKLMNATRPPEAYMRERDGAPTVGLAVELLAVLRRMGRRTEECAICLSPLDAHDADKPLDVLECLHCYHVACLREHVHTSAEVSMTSDRSFVNDVRRPGGDHMMYCLNGACPECRAPIQLLGMPAHMGGRTGGPASAVDEQD